MKNQNPGLPRLRVSENGRFLITEDKTPFFWLGDTAWELFHRSRHEEAEIYLKNRQSKKFTYVCVTRDINGRYAFAYLPLPSPVTVDLGKLDAGQVNVWWYNPRTGGATLEGKFSGGTFQTFTPPKNGPDWVLVVDDVCQAYQPPGVGRAY